jgi:hypothetical protein
MIIPNIKIKIDKESDIKLFKNFLNHPNFPQHRNLILKTFNNLKELLKENKNETESIKIFVNNFYEKNIDKIKNIINKDKKIINKQSKNSLKTLAEVMDYKWSKKITYEAKPTILPFSPYNEKTFYFSILSKIKNKKDDKNILETTLHEISHFILFDQLKKEIDHNLNRDAGYYLKESVTTAILNRKEFNFPKRKGNPEIRYINIIFKGKEYKLVNFVSKQIKLYGYKKAIINLVNLFEKNKNIFTEKIQLWNKHGKTIIKNKNILEKYKKSINF